MADSPVNPILDLLQKGLEIKITCTGQLPGEALVVALLNHDSTVRTTMAPELLKRWDAVLVQQIEDLQSVWRGIWVATGVLSK